VTRGTLAGSLIRRGVIYVAVEDSWKSTIVPRLMAAGADLHRVYRAEVRTAEDDTVSLSLPYWVGVLATGCRHESGHELGCVYQPTAGRPLRLGAGSVNGVPLAGYECPALARDKPSL